MIIAVTEIAIGNIVKNIRNFSSSVKALLCLKGLLLFLRFIVHLV